MFDPILIAGFIALFVAVGGVFLALNLLVGRLVRPQLPNTEKLEVYECGEPTIGSSFVQFDLRFYVVALLFIIFDVEVALFFPWATVFGKATQLADPAVVSVAADGTTLTPEQQVFIGSLVLRILKFHLSIPHHSNWLKLQQAVAKKHRGRQSLNGRLKKVDRCWQGQPLLICLCSM